MLIWFEELGMQILIWLLGLIDSIFSVFSVTSGIETVTVNGKESTTLASYFMGQSGVKIAFTVLLIAAVAICAVCTVVAIVKNIINGGEKKSHAKTLAQSSSTILVSLAMAMILVSGIFAADKLLGLVNTGINGDSQLIMSHEIINISVGSSGYELDVENVQNLNEFDENGNLLSMAYLYKFEKDANGKPKIFPDSPNNTECIIFLDPDGNPYSTWYACYEPVKTTVESEEGALYTKYVPIYEKLTAVPNATGWRDDYTKNSLKNNILDESPKSILGSYSMGGMGIFPKAWKVNGKVNPSSFNYLVAYLCSIIMLVALVGATFGLVKRLYDLVFLFITLPAISATIPLDDGAKFKLWRETVISKVFLAFGTVLAVNIFFIVSPTLWSVSIPNASNFTNTLLRLVLICGGALSISGGQLLMARLLGTSAEESREMAQSARTIMGGATTAIGVGKTAGRMTFGTKNANGQRVGGLVKGGAGVVGALGVGGVNAAGTLIGGNAYKSSKVGRGVGATRQAMRSFSQSAGWIGKDKNTGGNTLGGGVVQGLGSLGGKVVDKIDKNRPATNEGDNKFSAREHGVIGLAHRAKQNHDVKKTQSGRGNNRRKH